MNTGKKLIIIVGPTAVGKTAFAIEAATLLNTDIISADSRQCFKELNIGVAKPSPAELEKTRHYFINSHSIHEEVNAAVFEDYAMKAADEIFQSNNTAIMVGGTGLYVKAFCEGLDEIPAANEKVRQHITRQYEDHGLQWLQKEVQEKDLVFWQSCEQQNPQRLMRALEVIESTGKSITSFRKGAKQERPFGIYKIGLELPREQLYDRINRRVDQMIEQGLVEEVKGLLPVKNINALQTVGYKELFSYFEGKQGLDEAIDEIKKNTRHYAKRQLTWFKRDADIQWFSAEISPELALEPFFKP